LSRKKIVKWFTFLKKFEYTGGCGGVGTKFYYEEKSGPMLMKLHYEVTEWVENQRLAFKLTSGAPKKDDQVWALEATPTGSRFTLTEDFQMPLGILGKLMDFFLSSGVSKNVEKIVGNLKRVVEGEG
jgi:hypothetical protein